ncbi:GTP-binding protein TypA [Gracilaria domingensis]|nr:GTP-binding protein TypA [Gracilaria domingensis]
MLLTLPVIAKSFGGEVERILGMVDGAVLLVDATEGPMAQTKFVLSKALALNLKPIVVINKIDRETARPDAVESELFDLFASLDASEEQLDFTTVYASAKEGWASLALDKGRENGTAPLLDKIVELVPPPKVSTEDPFSFVVTMLGRDTFLGRIATGKVFSGVARAGDTVHVVDRNGIRKSNARITKIMASRGLKREELQVASAGDIVSLAGISDMSVGDTIAVPPPEATIADCANIEVATIKPLWAPAIDPPTVSMTFSVNDSPLAGKEGEVLTSQKLADWLHSEAENNVSIAVEEDELTDGLEVKGRGELQLGILVETLRREGAELALSPPRVLTKEDKEGNILEPVEEVHIEVDDAHSGMIIEKLSERQATLIEVKPALGNRTRISFLCPSRGLLGYRQIFTQDTRGTGIMNRIFAEWVPRKAPLSSTSGRKGLLISMASGMTSGHALASLEARGTLFIGPRAPVYTGMIIGENSRDMDIDVNPVKAKQLTNFRTHQKDETVRLTPPRIFSLEAAISYVTSSELIEVTPQSIRMRKRILDPSQRTKKKK